MFKDRPTWEQVDRDSSGGRCENFKATLAFQQKRVRVYGVCAEVVQSLVVKMPQAFSWLNLDRICVCFYEAVQL